MSTILSLARANLRGDISFENHEYQGPEEFTPEEIVEVRAEQEETAQAAIEAGKGLEDGTAEALKVYNSAITVRDQLQAIDGMDSRDAEATAGFANISLQAVAQGVGVEPVLVEIDEVGDVSTESALSWIKDVINSIRQAMALRWRNFKRSLQMTSNFEKNSYSRISKIQNNLSRRKGTGGNPIKLKPGALRHLLLMNDYTRDPLNDLKKMVEMGTQVVQVLEVETKRAAENIQGKFASMLSSKQVEESILFGGEFDKGIKDIIHNFRDTNAMFLGNHQLATRPGDIGISFDNPVGYRPENILRALGPITSMTNEEIGAATTEIRTNLLPRLAGLHNDVREIPKDLEEVLNKILAVLGDEWEYDGEYRAYADNQFQAQVRKVASAAAVSGCQVADDVAILVIEIIESLQSYLTWMEESIFQD